jgi:hypothetical protein
MLEAASAYLVAISAMLLAGLSALTLIYTVNHFDPPESASPHEPVERPEHIAA